MNYIDTLIPEVKIIKPNVFGNDCGFLMETFRVDEFTQSCTNKAFVQNKLVRVTSGETYGIVIAANKTNEQYNNT